MTTTSPLPTPDLLGVGVLALGPGILLGLGGDLAEAFLVLGDLVGVNLAFESFDAIPGMNMNLTALTTQCFGSKPDRA